MLKTILKITELNAIAFKAKPINKNLLIASKAFWERKYKEKIILGIYDELNLLVTVLCKAINQLVLSAGLNIDLSREISATLEKLNQRCKNFDFKKHLAEIKKQLEIITYYFAEESSADKKAVALAVALLETNVCAEGCSLKLQQIACRINEHADLFNWLADFRLDILYRFFCQGMDKSVHSFNAILTYAQKIGLNVIDEEIAGNCVSDPHAPIFCPRAAQELSEFFASHYTVETITQYITDKLSPVISERLQEFYIEIPGFGFVIPNQINPAQLEKKLIGLPLQQAHKLLQPINEEETCYQIKSNVALKREVARCLCKESIFQKKEKSFQFNNESWVFTIIKGDSSGDYGFIANSQEELPLFAFEESKLYKYFTLEGFHSSKPFLRLGNNAVKHFYLKRADFSHCYLMNIDFTVLQTDFLATACTFAKAYFIRPKLTYKQFVDIYTHKKETNIHTDCIVEIKTPEQFLYILTTLLDLTTQKRTLFLAQHKDILTKNRTWYTEILQGIDKKKHELQKQLNGTQHKAERLNTLEFSLISTYCIHSIAVLGIITAGLFFSPCLYLGFQLLCANILILYLYRVALHGIENKQIHYHKQISQCKKEGKRFTDLESNLNTFKNEHLLFKKTEIKSEDSLSNQIASSLPKVHANPTSMSGYLFKIPTKSANETLEQDILVANENTPHLTYLTP
jgi:hypothetical protein